ncbi:MAG TPA: DEAD/DEAH box helicase [Pyrinomonadaceae bacterium]|nr:DEAD/DEAH box helicase [Pyrinomonadaceae bacterium]
MPLLAAQLADYFTHNIKERGRQYFTAGAVRLVKSQARYIRAKVRGSTAYRVELRLNGNQLRATCTCPYFETQDLCKHLWATILTVEAENTLQDAANVRSLQLTFEDESAFDDEEDEEPFIDYTAARPIKSLTASRPAARKGEADWKQRFTDLSRAMKERAARSTSATWPASGREILYLVDAPASRTNNALILEVGFRERKAKGEWGKIKSPRLSDAQIHSLPDPSDRQILLLLAGAREHYTWEHGGYYGYEGVPSRCRLSAPLQRALLPLMCATNRCRLRRSEADEELPVLRWDAAEDDKPWDFWLEVRPAASGKKYVFAGVLRRGETRLPLSAALLILPHLIINHDLTIAPLDDAGAPLWLALLREQGDWSVPAAQAQAVLAEMLNFPQVPRLDLPAELRYEERRERPQLRLRLHPPRQSGWNNRHLRGELSFAYAGTLVNDEDARRAIFQAEVRQLLHRDPIAEEEARARLKQLGFRLARSNYGSPPTLELHPNNLARTVRTLVAEGWHVEAEGKLYRSSGALRVAVKSGIDWFELHGTLEFDGDVTATLPELLAALKRGDNAVRLGDGTFGLLPEEWLRKYAALAGLGTAAKDHLRFRPSQTGLLDALLAAMPEPTYDEVFARARDRWRNFSGVQPHDPPVNFHGQLRPYQREGLGWFHFLREFNFGGCLADDMGLGKTIQVLALLETRRARKNQSAAPPPKRGQKTPAKIKPRAGTQEAPWRPSLVVVPKSLIFNWQQEAARFTPQLRVLNHTGPERANERSKINDYDLVLTTYGTLRRDVEHLRQVNFDYLVLDEAQAIKNAQTDAAKATRLLRGTHKLALSGTPIENHLGELWSLFEFLNPGMLGTAPIFQQTINSAGGSPGADEQTRALLSRALRPFILRRTKEQVARELPRKLEQTLACEMEPAQRKFYDELRAYYRQSLLDRVARDGINKAKIHVLEALLRLRQAACHPGLVNKDHLRDPSAKLDLLLPHLAEVIAGGHKALVFSQFTSFLHIVREKLEHGGLTYEYLDGRTRDRAAKVARFQTDPQCPLFLISLKAGGLGLNLTAAEYIFLLDPWWNPAIEAQAIDRAHRIGQTQRVFAYRLIARDTVEEKVLELQQTKRHLADAIITADNSLVRQLNREDLELLLS